MPNFTFICENYPDLKDGYPGRRNVVEFSAETWPDVVSEMTDFLRGCGYQFKGELQMVEEDESEKHSKYYFDFDRNR